LFYSGFSDADGNYARDCILNAMKAQQLQRSQTVKSEDIQDAPSNRPTHSRLRT